MQTDDPKILAKKILKFEELTRKSGEVQKKLEDELSTLKKQLKNKQEVEEIMKQEIIKTKQNYRCLQNSYSKLNHDYLTLMDLMRDKKVKRQELSRSLRNLQMQLSDEQIQKSN
jgi:archaellum component FlaC